MNQREFPRGGAYGGVAKRLCVVILCGLLSSCLMTKKSVFGQKDFVPVKGLVGVYKSVKTKKTVTVRVQALNNGRYLITPAKPDPGKKTKDEPLEVGFVPLDGGFYLGVFTNSGHNDKVNNYLLAAVSPSDVELWYFWPGSENRKNVHVQSSLARHGLSVDLNGRITKGKDGAPPSKNLKAFFRDVTGKSANKSNWKKHTFKLMAKLVKVK